MRATCMYAKKHNCGTLPPYHVYHHVCMSYILIYFTPIHPPISSMIRPPFPPSTGSGQGASVQEIPQCSFVAIVSGFCVDLHHGHDKQYIYIKILNNLATCNLVAEAHEANQWNCRCAYKIDVFKQVEEKAISIVF